MARRLAFVLALAACSSGAETAPAGEWDGTTSRLGDTTVVTTHGGTVAGRHVLDSVTVLWRSDLLEQPTQVVLVGESRVAVADRNRIHLISTDGLPVATLGGEGEGPGEFIALGPIGATDSSIVGVDRRNRHWARFAADGALRGSGVMAPTGDYANLVPARVGAAGDTLRLVWGSLIFGSGKPSFGGVLRHPPGEAPVEEARVTGDGYVFGTSGNAALASLFGPRPLLAIGPDGRIAMGDGVEYCVTVVGSGQPMRICRDWQAIPPAPSVRSPDWDAVARESGTTVEGLAPVREVVELIAVGDRRHALSALNFDSDGRLWVHAADSSTAAVHPILIRFTPSRRPPHRQWDVFDRQGRLHWQLHLPTRFTPWDARGETIYGLYETESGELVVATIGVPVGGEG